MKGTQVWVVLLCASGLVAQARLDYPLAPKTRWTYHIRQEIGPGTHFNDNDAKKAKGNVMEDTVVSEVAGADTISGRQYTRVESRRDGKPWLFEWMRLAPEGLIVGKSVDYEEGETETTMMPEQRRISASLRPKDFWYWQARNEPVRFRYDVLGSDEVQVPAGHYSAVHLTCTGTVKVAPGSIDIHQETWFVPGVGIVKQETRSSIAGHLLSHVVLTLEKLEKP